MKKLIILLISLAMGCPVFAQFPAFCIGPKIGYNTTKLSTEASSITSDLKRNFQFGAFLRIGDKIYLQPEVNYVTKGGVFSGNQVTLKTLTCPLLLGKKVIDLKVASVHLMAGPAVSFALEKNLNLSNLSETGSIQTTDDIKNSYWSIQAGAGIDVLMFTLDVRYEAGLSNIFKVSNFSIKNNVLNVSLGLKLF